MALATTESNSIRFFRETKEDWRPARSFSFSEQSRSEASWGTRKYFESMFFVFCKYTEAGFLQEGQTEQVDDE